MTPLRGSLVCGGQKAGQTLLGMVSCVRKARESHSLASLCRVKKDNDWTRVASGHVDRAYSIHKTWPANKEALLMCLVRTLISWTHLSDCLDDLAKNGCIHNNQDEVSTENDDLDEDIARSDYETKLWQFLAKYPTERQFTSEELNTKPERAHSSRVFDLGSRP